MGWDNGTTRNARSLGSVHTVVDDEQPAALGDPPAPYGVSQLRQYAGTEVRVRLDDGTSWSGRLRTGLLTERSLSVYIVGLGGEGTTLYIDQITEIVPVRPGAG